MSSGDVSNWLLARLPAELAAGAPEVRRYDDEMVIVLQLDTSSLRGGEDTRHEDEQRLIAQQREASRALRMQLAREMQGGLQIPVSWGMRAGGSEELFTTRTVPVMTRLNRSEREVLDTLVAAGVAETRSAALAYTVRAFALSHSEWLTEVGAAIEQVQQVRSKLKLRPRAGKPPVSAPAEDDG